jgi:predicted transcriptional regulator
LPCAKSGPKNPEEGSVGALRREKTSVRLEPELMKWLRRRANERHTTVSAVIEDCVRRAAEADRLEWLARACLEGVARLLAGPDAGPEKVREAKKALVAAAKGELLDGQGGDGAQS